MAPSGTQMVGARPEVELLLLCARTQMDSERAARVEALLQEDINWDYLLETAQEHGVMPFLFWNLNAICPEAVPKATIDQLRSRFRNNAQRNVFMAGELLRLLNLFETQEISAVPLKGPSLAESIYGNLALRRQSVDLDVLVREQDVLRAKDLLLHQGYRPEHEWALQETLRLQASHEYPFVHHDRRIKVELHWKITPEYFSFSPDLELLWKRLRPSFLAGHEVMTPSPEDLLLILCVHGTKHLWQGLGLVCDVAELVHNKKLDWEQTMKQARELGSERMLFLGLFLASDLLGASLPNEVLQRMWADSSARTLAAQVCKQLFYETDNQPGILDSSLFHLRAKEHLQDRVRYCIRLTMSPDEWDYRALPLPASLSPFYYILRPIRLMKKYGPSLLRRSL